MSELDPILEAAYRRAGIQVESTPAPVEPAAAVEVETAPLTENEITAFALARAGIIVPAEPEKS